MFFFPTDVKLFLLWWCWERCKIVWPCVHKTTRGQGCSSDNCIIYSIYKQTNVSIISNRRTPLFHLLRRRTGWHTKQEEKQNVEFTHTHAHAHVTVSKMILKPPYQGSVCVFGPTVLIPRTMKLYHSKHHLMEADSRPIYLRLLLV